MNQQLQEAQKQLDDPNAWQDPEKTKAASSRHKQITHLLDTVNTLGEKIQDALELYDLTLVDSDQALATMLQSDVEHIETAVAELEMQRFFTGKQDSNNAYIDIQAGSGGTEAQDWAQMLMRMYTRWAESHDFKADITQIMPGEVAGIRNVTLLISGQHAFGWLKTESGVHRLVRKSPFDSGNRRHTSFASVFIYPEVSDDVTVDINPADLRIDTYRSSGAGGQHVNTTDSAVRITHIPTSIVVQCQAERSQHKNKASAMKQLQAKLYQVAQAEQNQEKQALEESKDDITWGQQIRSYVLDQSRIKDLRTGVEVNTPQTALDGDIDIFIRASLQKLASENE